jgi:hypothetical protein
MATLIQAIASYGPRIDMIKAASSEKFIRMITQRTTLSTGVVKNVQESEVETLIELLMEGRPVHTGVAIFTPSIDTQGKLHVTVRVDRRIVSALNAENGFTGTINNSENIGLTREQYVALWNEEHPDDPIVLEPSEPALQVSEGLRAS